MSENVKEIQSHTVISTESFKFKWSIKNFSVCGLEGSEYLTSPEFATGSSSLTTWNLVLYPNRNKSAEKDGKVGIYLQRKSKDSSTHYACVQICIIGSNNTKYYPREFNYLYSESKDQCWGYQNFIKRNVLFGEEKSILLPQDILTVMCELKTSRVNDYKSFESTNLPKATTSTFVFKKPDSLISDLQRLYNSNMLSDLTLRVGDEEFKAHKIILCARSSVFNTMLNCEMEEKLTNIVNITDFDPPTLKIMLHYIYCGQVKGLTPEIGIQLYSAAEKYNLQDLKDKCVEYLSTNLSVDNFCDVLILGNLHNEESLKTATKNFFSVNVAAIRETENWLNLSKTNPDLVIAMYEVIFSKTKM